MKDRKPKKDLLVVKVGTNVLTDTTSERIQLDAGSFKSIGEDIDELTDTSTGVVLVSSGAITAGYLRDDQQRDGNASMPELQYYAARGWQNIVERWDQSIPHRPVVPTLLTKHELTRQSTCSRMLAVAAVTLLEHDGVLLVNENDVIDDSEIKFGDNDTLAAELACQLALSGLYRSTKLALLTTAGGLNRVAEDDSTLIPVVHDIPDVERYAGDAANGHSRGGMITKVMAAKIARVAGIETFIANGREPRAISRSISGDIGTHFKLP